MAVSRSRLLVTGALCRRGLVVMFAGNRCASFAIKDMAVVESAPDRPRSWSSTRLDATLESGNGYGVSGRRPGHVCGLRPRSPDQILRSYCLMLVISYS